MLHFKKHFILFWYKISFAMVRSKTSSDTFSQDILSISKSKRQKCHVVDQEYKFSENFQKKYVSRIKEV